MQKYQEENMLKLANLMRARFPYVYIPTWEEERAIGMIRDISHKPELIKTVRKLYIWTSTNGFICDEDKTEVKDTGSPMRAIEFVEKHNEDSVFVFKDMHMCFGAKNRLPEYLVIRKLRDIIPILETSEVKKNVIFISPELVIPDDMQKEISVFEFPLPKVEEIKEVLNEIIADNEAITVDLTEEEKERLSKAALGLTLQGAENAFAKAIVDDGKIDVTDIGIILDEKNQIIKKTGVLEFVKTDLNINDVGGLENLKKWLQKRNNSWLDAAKEYNLPAPKGVLITGVPGCGKSLTAKAISAMWQLPLLNMDMGKLFSGLVGSSEENMRKAIETAEAVSPSILWVDEIEKGVAGVGSSGDSGTSTRVFGTFLTWMQEKKSPVFVIATANNISGLPPELLRKGRFDEIFFVDLPTKRERKEIFKVHLNKKLTNKKLLENIELNDELCEELAGQTEGFSGAEIEETVIASLYEAFFEKRGLLKTDLEKIIKNIIPLSKTSEEQIKNLRDWANVRAVSATIKEDLENYNKSDSDNQDISKSRGGRNLDF